MNKKQSTIKLKALKLILFLAISVILSFSVLAEEPICAVVKIEIAQTLTLERQAFDARMKITNALDSISLENLNISVNFEDTDGNTVFASSDSSDTNAQFYIRIASMDGVDDISGAGTIAPKAEAEIHWIIIPAPGSGGNISTGKKYLVGAELSYNKSGVEEVIQVAPDDIYVKPMPLLTLDYFIPNDVTADDAFTLEVEPPIPFSLGVRVRNNGSGVAHNLKIESAQPRIVENEQGLLIGFKLIGSTIDEQLTTPSLLADFGDIEGGSSSIARWLMTVTLSGRVTEFSAEFSHADALGGDLTSLIEDIHAHFLIHDVLVDVTGRDAVRDFLAKDGDVIRIYESDTDDSKVNDVSVAANFVTVGSSGSELIYRLTMPVSDGFIYAKITDPFNGKKLIKEVIRSDGKRLSEHNAWFSQSRSAKAVDWEHFFNLFDVNTTGSYTVVMQDAAEIPQPPALQFIPSYTTYEGNPIGFTIEASDPNGTIPNISAAPLPDGANFIDQSTGIAQLTWIPVTGQAGLYTITYKASDGVLHSTRVASIRVNPASDTDGDGVDDDWERQHFGNLDRDGAGDLDRDGVSDLQEFLDDTDPQVGSGLTAPVIVSPLPGSEVTSLTPDITLINSVHAPIAVVQYDFEIYSDASYTNQLTSINTIIETENTTTGTVSTPLSDNTWYHWRARAYDGLVYSQWVNGRFFVNSINDAPDPLAINFPADSLSVDSLLPLLSVTNSSDIDGDTIKYDFDVFTDSTLNNRVAFVTGRDQGATGVTEWTVTPALTDHLSYYWRVTAVDEHGAETQSNVVNFIVNTGIEAPGLPSIVAPTLGSEVNNTDVTVTVKNGTNPTSSSLYYYFEIDTSNSFDSANKIESGSIPEGANMTNWTITGLAEDTVHYWRAKASTGTIDSAWVQSNFIYNAENSAPNVPTISNPDNFAWVETVRPMLAVHSSVDFDNDTINYRFELYRDSQLTDLVREFVTDNREWSILFAIQDNSWSYWRVRAEDEHGALSNWTPVSSFFVNNNGIDNQPTITLIEPSVDMTDVPFVTISWDDNDPDSNASITLFYDNNSSGADGVLLAESIAEDFEGISDTYQWDTSMLAPGTYYVHAEISDDLSTQSVYALGSITINQTNRAPELVNPMVDQIFDVATGFYDFTPPVNVFNDPDGDALTYSATLTNGAPLPPWLLFTLVSGSVNLGGTPSSSDIGYYAIRITVTDTSGDSVFDEFGLTITEQQVVSQGWQDVSGQLTTMVSNPIRSRRSPDAQVPIEIINPHAASMMGSLRFVIKGLTPSTLVISNANGVTDSGDPYIDLTPYVGSELLPGGTTGSFTLSVQGGGKVTFSFTPIVEQLK